MSSIYSALRQRSHSQFGRMRRVSAVSCVLIFLILWTSTGWSQQANPDSTPKVEAKPTKTNAKSSKKKAKQPKLRVVASVVDDITDRPIEEFRVVRASGDGGSRSITWQSHTRKTCKDGIYKWQEERAWQSTLLRIDADGYRPYISRAFRDNEFDVQLEVRMVRSPGIVGKVLTPDGKPAEGAQVALCTWTNEVNVEKGGLRHSGPGHDLAKIATTAKDGSFRLADEPNPWVIVVAHESGYAEPKSDEFGPSGEIKLQPWGRLEGEYVVDGKPIAGQIFNVGAGRGDVEVNLHYNDSVTTDAAGKFVVEKVAPVRLFVHPFFKAGEFSVSLWWFSGSVKIESGKTTKMSLPRIGQPVIGRIKPPAGDRLKLSDFNFDVSLYLRQPRIGGFGPAAGGEFQAYSDFMASAAGAMFKRSEIPVDASGSFRVERLPETEYILHIHATQKPETVPQGARPLDGFLGRRVTIPPHEGPEEKVDLGEIELQWQERTVENGEPRSED